VRAFGALLVAASGREDRGECEPGQSMRGHGRQPYVCIAMSYSGNALMSR
jgi:hypothetical protein